MLMVRASTFTTSAGLLGVGRAQRRQHGRHYDAGSCIRLRGTRIRSPRPRCSTPPLRSGVRPSRKSRVDKKSWLFPRQREATFSAGNALRLQLRSALQGRVSKSSSTTRTAASGRTAITSRERPLTGCQASGEWIRGWRHGSRRLGSIRSGTTLPGARFAGGAHINGIAALRGPRGQNAVGGNLARQPRFRTRCHVRHYSLYLLLSRTRRHEILQYLEGHWSQWTNGWRISPPPYCHSEAARNRAFAVRRRGICSSQSV